MQKTERTLIIMKPDCLQRNLVGEVVGRFERKGLKIVGMKMTQLTDVLLEDHYAHHKDKPFFADLKKFMKSAPCVIMALQGVNAIKAIRIIVGPTKGHEADAGSIRGDLSMGVATNIVHASDSPEAAEAEINRFFNENEIFEYGKIDEGFIFGE